jgi:serine/threonine-protein kinase
VAAHDADPLIGRQLQQYLVLALLGRGGMGVVYKARDVRLERDVALKVLPPGQLGDDVRRQRFLREARAASALSHPSIITIFEIDSADGFDFIVMELIAGATLAQSIPPQGMAADQAMRFALQMVDGIAAAHRAGLVHRDLKPGNLMIRGDGALKILDFGLAKLRSADDDETLAQLTASGHVVGTVAYMSPEQARGEDVGPASDVFSLGVILYQMISGRMPFQGSGLSVLHALIEGRFAPLVDVRPDCPGPLAEVIAKALRPEPRQRYANAGEMLADLRRAAGVASAAEMSPTVSVVEPAAAVAVSSNGRSRRHTLWRASIAAVVLAMAALAWYAVPRSVAPADATAPTAVDGATTSPGALTQSAAELLRLHYRDGNVDRAIEQLGQALRLNEAYAPAEARLSLAYWRKNSRSPDPVLRQQALSYAESAVKHDPQLAVAHVALGAARAALGQLDEAAAAFAAAETLDPANPELQRRLGDLAVARNDSTRAAKHYARSVESGRGEWESHSQLGTFQYRQGQYAEALASFTRMQELAPDHSRAYSNLAAVLHQLDRTDEAAAQLQRAIEIAPAAPIYDNLGTLLYFQGRYKEAADAFARSVQLGANTYLRWGNLADAERMTPGGRAKAHDTYTRAIQLARDELSTHPEDTAIRSSLALYLARDGQVKEARNELAATLKQPTLTGSVLFKLALAAEITGDRTRAVTLLARALDAGYPMREVRHEPDLVQMRTDAEYHRLVSRFER